MTNQEAAIDQGISIMIGGDAGQGVESSGAGLTLALARAGLHVFALQDYRSQIRGGHNFYEIRVARRPLYSHRDPIHVLLALTPESVQLHIDGIAPGGAVIYPDRFEVDRAALETRGVRAEPLPLSEIAERHGNRLMVNTAGLAAVAALINFPLRYMEDVIRENFGRKSADLAEANLGVAREAHAAALERFGEGFPYRVSPDEETPRRLLMSGNEALALGALVGGCRFISAYPMTPATSIIEWLARVPDEFAVVTKHAEDEIAAVCMAIGASFAGARAMTATSGGGFCLMVEAMGLAGMTEIPLVIVEAQRGGPSTGLPTRTEQSDLLFTLYAAHGEFPRIVLAPGTVEQCFEAGWRSFNLAERYQCPVVVLTDQFLSSSLRSLEVDAIDFESVVIDRGKLVDVEKEGVQAGYRRFEMSEDGISPRAFPGHETVTVTASSDEHDERGHITEDSENRVRMMKKRMRKIETARAEMRAPALYGPAGADQTIACWGSTYGACREAVDEMLAEGASINLLQFSDLLPMSGEAVRQTLDACRRVVTVEQNFTSQLGQLLQTTTGRRADAALNKYDGRPFSPGEIISALKELT